MRWAVLAHFPELDRELFAPRDWILELGCVWWDGDDSVGVSAVSELSSLDNVKGALCVEMDSELSRGVLDIPLRMRNNVRGIRRKEKKKNEETAF